MLPHGYGGNKQRKEPIQEAAWQRTSFIRRGFTYKNKDADQLQVRADQSKFQETELLQDEGSENDRRCFWKKLVDQRLLEAQDLLMNSPWITSIGASDESSTEIRNYVDENKFKTEVLTENNSLNIVSTQIQPTAQFNRI